MKEVRRTGIFLHFLPDNLVYFCEVVAVLGAHVLVSLSLAVGLVYSRPFRWQCVFSALCGCETYPITCKMARGNYTACYDGTVVGPVLGVGMHCVHISRVEKRGHGGLLWRDGHSLVTMWCSKK